MAEKTKFLSGEILTATNLNQAFNEKLNKTSVDEKSTINIEDEGINIETNGENGINIETSEDIKITSNELDIDTENNVSINIAKDSPAGSGEFSLRFGIDPGINPNNPDWDEYNGVKFFTREYRNNTSLEILPIRSTKVIIDKPFVTNTIRLTNSVLYNREQNSGFLLPSNTSDYHQTLITEEACEPRTRTYFYKVSVISGTTTLDGGVTDLQAGDINTLSKLYDKINDYVMNTSNNYTSDKIYLIIEINGTTQTLRLCGKSLINGTTRYYFNNTEYKIWIDSTTGLVSRTGFNSASIIDVKTTSGTSLMDANPSSRITYYLDDNGNIVKVLSFYIMRKYVDASNRITQIVMPISVNEFPLYEGDNPTLRFTNGVCGVHTFSSTSKVENRLYIQSSNISQDGINLILNIEWTDRPSSSVNYGDEPCCIYAEWI